MRRFVFAVPVVIALCASPAFAGPAYVAPKYTIGTSVEAPAGLRANATELLAAVRKADAIEVARWFAPKVTTISGALDLAVPRSKSVEGPFKDGAAAVVALGNSTGGDGDLPQGADIGAHMTAMELSFIAQSLTDGRAWGTDPMVKGAICTYALASYDLAAVKKAAKLLEIEASGFVAVGVETPLLSAPKRGAKTVGSLSPGLFYAIDYDTDTPTGFTAMHLPAGGTAFVEQKGVDFLYAYASGLCFRQQKSGEWLVVAQTATGL